jgi:tetratricopeptide (TPR) repeat protein
MVAALAMTAARRNADWTSLLTIWLDCARKSPGKSRVHNHLGNSYFLLKRYFPAIEEYRMAVQLDQGNLDATYNLAIALDYTGSRAEAMPYYEKFCASAPRRCQEQKDRACDRLRELAGYQLD